MRRKIAGTVGSVLLCALLLAGCGSVTASQQQEGETSMAGSASESQVDIDVSSSKAELDDEQAQKLRVQAEELFEESEYRKSSDTAKKAYDLSQNEEAYNSLIKKIIEALAKNCGFDNPQALRTTNIYGNMEWYLSCDGISGTPLEELPEEKIIEKFKDFRQNYHDTLNPYGSLSFSFGNTTIGDFYCNGIWYDVYIDDMFGEKDYMTVYTDDEQHQKITETVEDYEIRKICRVRLPDGLREAPVSVNQQAVRQIILAAYFRNIEMHLQRQNGTIIIRICLNHKFANSLNMKAMKKTR